MNIHDNTNHLIHTYHFYVERLARSITTGIGIMGLILTFWFVVDQYTNSYYYSAAIIYPNISSDNNSGGVVSNNTVPIVKKQQKQVTSKWKKSRYIVVKRKRRNNDIFSDIFRFFKKGK